MLVGICVQTERSAHVESLDFPYTSTNSLIMPFYTFLKDNNLIGFINSHMKHMEGYFFVLTVIYATFFIPNPLKAKLIGVHSRLLMINTITKVTKGYRILSV